jgi:hypothetical protein
MSLIVNLFILVFAGSCMCGRGSLFGASRVKNYQSVLWKDSVSNFDLEQHGTTDRFAHFFKLCLRISGGHSGVSGNEDDEFSESIDLPRDDANSTLQEMNNLVLEMNSVLARLTSPSKVIDSKCRLNLEELSIVLPSNLL